MNPADASYQDPRADMPPGYVMQYPGQATYANQPPHSDVTGYSVPPGYAPPPGQAPPGYPPPGYAGQTPPGYPFPGYTSLPVQAQQGYPLPGYAPPGYAPYAGAGYPSSSVAPDPGMAYGVPYGYAMPVGQVPPQLAARAAFAAFAAGMPPDAVAGIARMMGFPQQPQDNDPRNRITMGQWDAGLCRCCTDCIPNGLMAFVCPCVSLAQIFTRLGSPARYGAVLTQFACLWLLPIIARLMPEIMLRSMGVSDVVLPPVVNLPLVMPLLMLGLVVANLRQRVRTRYKIPASPCEDCAVGVCCMPCALAQIATHVRSYTPGNCSFDPPDMLPPFQ